MPDMQEAIDVGRYLGVIIGIWVENRIDYMCMWWGGYLGIIVGIC